MIDIANVLERGGISYALAPHARVRTGWVGCDCPKCSPGSSKFRLGFEIATGRAHCWVCGTVYGPEVLAMLLRIPQREAHTLLGSPRRVRPPAADERPIGVLKAPAGVGELLPAHRAYLESRRLDPDEVSRVWGVGGIGMAGGRLKWRLYIPIFDDSGRQISWTTRAISPDAKTRYWAASEEEEERPHKSVLYGAHKARHTIAIVEGPIDAITLGPGAVATCGVGFTAAQKSLMAQYPVRIVCFDAEDEAQGRAAALCEELSLMPGLTENVTWETGKDPNECSPDEVQEFKLRYFPELYTA